MTFSQLKVIFIAAFAAFAPVGVSAQEGAAQTAPTEEGKPELVRIAYGGGWDGLPAIVAIERGFFHQENLVASGASTTTVQALANSVVTGSTDFAAIPQRTFIALAAAELPIKAVAIGISGTRMELIAKPDSQIQGLADLKGKTVAISRSSESLAIFVRLLNAFEMRVTDVNLSLLEPEKVTTAFDDDLAEAIFESRHYTAAMVEAGKAKTVMPAQEIRDTIGVIDAMPLITRNALIEQDPGLVQRTVSAWIKALIYIQQDPEDAARLLQIYMHRQGVQVPTDMAQQWVAIADYNRYKWTEPVVSDAEYNAWGLTEAQVLKAAPKISSYIDNRFADQALEDLGVE